MRTLAARLLIVLGLVQVVVFATPVLRYWTGWLAPDWNSPRGDVLVVLAAEGPAEGGLTGYSSYWRAVYAAACSALHEHE